VSVITGSDALLHGTKEVRGWTAPGFGRVRDLLTQHSQDIAPGGAAFAASIYGEPVVDLWVGMARQTQRWHSDTLAVLFSASKGLTTLCAQVLAEQGLLDVGAPVAAYWPEFGVNGKDKVTVLDVLTHAAGLVGLDNHTDLLSFDGAGFDCYDEIAARLAAARPDWPPGTAHGYHASTYGWLVGELVRRITGASLGTYFRYAIARPLGLDLHIGTPEPDLPRVATVIAPPTDTPRTPQAAAALAWMRDPTSLAGKAYFARPGGNILDHGATVMNAPRMLRAELGGGNATGTARSLARLYALHACGGELDGVRLLSQETLDAWAAQRRSGVDLVLQAPWRWATGYHLQADVLTLGGAWPLPLGPNPDAYGHGGYGGQVAGVDPVTGVSIGFVRSTMRPDLGLGGLLAAAVHDAI
jgi:CubicO group peptidase (beta-lactamase class C family)